MECPTDYDVITGLVIIFFSGVVSYVVTRLLNK